MQSIEQYIVPLAASNLVFGLTLIAAIKRPMVARVFLVICFLGAGIFNILTAMRNPGAYLTYADLTPLQLYRDFITGYFSSHTSEFVTAIAIGQILTGLALILDDRWTRLACAAGLIFGVAIAPLGIGSAFPSTIVMSLSFYVLMNKGQHDFIWKWDQYRVGA